MDWFEKKETESWTIILPTGEVKTLLNWCNNREHISSLSFTSNCVCGFMRGQISLLQMLFFLANIKKKLGSSLILATAIDSSLNFSLK